MRLLRTFVPAVLAGTMLALPAAAQPIPHSEPELRPQSEAPLDWPLEPVPAVTRPFDPPEHRYGTGHRGVDLAATPGQPVLAADTGVVVFAGMLAGRGVISIQHHGLRTTYEPVRASVAAGDRVHRGQVIGTVRPGHPGCTVSACLHWGVRRNGWYLNPVLLVRTEVRIRLKPWNKH